MNTRHYLHKNICPHRFPFWGDNEWSDSFDDSDLFFFNASDEKKIVSDKGTKGGGGNIYACIY